VRLTANAATTDPDAIHDNVANEISAITEKLVPHDDDLVLIEDSENSFVKKKVKKENMGGARNPAKLGSEYSPSLLYTFEGVRTNAGSSGSTWDFNNTVGEELYTIASTFAKKSLWTADTTGTYTSASTPASSVAAVGEVTVQAVILFGDTTPESGIVNSNIFMLADDADGGEMLWGLRGLTAGSIQMQPAFVYKDSAAATITVTDADFRIGDSHLMHIVGRREDDGGGGYDVSLWVNGVKIAETTGQLESAAANSSHRVWFAKTSAANTGMCRSGVEGLKVSNVALTDAEIAIEYRAVIGAPVL
jgi:hypothetical protein